jgi:hypothetical protein
MDQEASKQNFSGFVFLDYFLGLFFYLEDGGSTFLQNVGEILRLYAVTSQKTRRCNIPKSKRERNKARDESFPYVRTRRRRMRI